MEEYRGATISKHDYSSRYFQWTHPENLCKETDGEIVGIGKSVRDCKDQIDELLDLN